MKNLNVYSMTGFASARQIIDNETLTLELRSVNSRFLDLSFRMPDELRASEPILREKLSARLARGKVECRVSWGRSQDAKTLPVLDLKLIEHLGALEERIEKILPRIQRLSTNELLHWPGVIEDQSVPQEKLLAAIGSLADESVQQLLAARGREGERLVDVLLEKISGMKKVLSDLRPQIPEFLKAYETKIRARTTETFASLLVENEVDIRIEELAERIKHEVALFSVRIDVQEELDRLSSHFKEIERILAKGGVVGKKLDFICQELNREANTLGSKAHAYAQTQASVELKVLIEQLREQVQNLE